MEQADALAALESTVREFNGDRARLYLTGLSMGGYGAFSIAGKHPHLFAAAAVVCGGIRPPEQFPHLRDKVKLPRHIDPYAEAARGSSVESSSMDLAMAAHELGVLVQPGRGGGHPGDG